MLAAPPVSMLEGWWSACLFDSHSHSQGGRGCCHTAPSWHRPPFRCLVFEHAFKHLLSLQAVSCEDAVEKRRGLVVPGMNVFQARTR